MNHRYGFLMEKETIDVFSKYLDIISINKDRNRREYVSTIKFKKYPYILNDAYNSSLKKPKITKKITQSDNNIVSKLKDLKELFDSGVLTKEEFEKAKKKLLN